MSKDISGGLHKLRAELVDPVNYFLPVGEQEIALNALLGQPLQIEYSGKIFCANCGRKTNNSFNQGFCYPCFKKLARCDSCIVSPEKCHYHLDTCREPQWGEEHCMIPHVVYLANSSGSKVGITRGTQIPTRWIDQGAVQAVPIIGVQTRYQSGLVEVALKQHIADKTNWRAMLKGPPEPIDLITKKHELLTASQAELGALQDQFGLQAVQLLEDQDPQDIAYPVITYPEKITALNLDKTPLVSGTLLGIKGQYLLLDSGVLNIRKFTAYDVVVST
ncbi:MAG: DUF2797 domain-containing protein [Pseudomonadales bacterium]